MTDVKSSISPAEAYAAHRDRVFIYGLCDPRDGRTRYVGQSTDPETRLTSHIGDALRSNHKSPLASWLRQLHYQYHLRPQLLILDVCFKDNALDIESQWILKLSACEPHLLNIVGNPQYTIPGEAGIHRVRRDSLVTHPRPVGAKGTQKGWKQRRRARSLLS
jgi:hypothetical protein